MIKMQIEFHMKEEAKKMQLLANFLSKQYSKACMLVYQGQRALQQTCSDPLYRVCHSCFINGEHNLLTLPCSIFDFFFHPPPLLLQLLNTIGFSQQKKSP